MNKARIKLSSTAAAQFLIMGNYEVWLQCTALVKHNSEEAINKYTDSIKNKKKANNNRKEVH